MGVRTTARQTAADCNTYAYRYGYTHANRYGNRDRQTNDYSDTDGHADTYQHTYANRNSDYDTHAYGYACSDGYRDSHCRIDIYACADGNARAAYADAAGCGRGSDGGSRA